VNRRPIVATDHSVAHGAARRAPLERDQKAFRALVVARIVAFVNLPLAKFDQFFVPSFSLLFPLVLAVAGFLALSGFHVFPISLSFTLCLALAGVFLALEVLPLTFGRLLGQAPRALA